MMPVEFVISMNCACERRFIRTISVVIEVRIPKNNRISVLEQFMGVMGLFILQK